LSTTTASGKTKVELEMQMAAELQKRQQTHNHSNEKLFISFETKRNLRINPINALVFSVLIPTKMRVVLVCAEINFFDVFPRMLHLIS